MSRFSQEQVIDKLAEQMKENYLQIEVWKNSGIYKGKTMWELTTIDIDNPIIKLDDNVWFIYDEENDKEYYFSHYGVEWRFYGDEEVNPESMERW